MLEVVIRTTRGLTSDIVAFIMHSDCYLLFIPWYDIIICLSLLNPVITHGFFDECPVANGGARSGVLMHCTDRRSIAIISIYPAYLYNSQYCKLVYMNHSVGDKT